MADLYIATKTQADYDALMRLAEAAGYVKSSNEITWERLKETTVVKLSILDDKSKTIMHYATISCKRNNWTVETIPNLAEIKSIWNVKPKYKNAFNDEKLDTSDIFKDWALNDGVIILLKNGSYDLGFEEIYKALAVEYKPKESEEVMSKTVKLPKFLCDQISTLKGSLSIEKISGPKEAVEFMNRLKKMYGKANVWLRDSRENQWKLIDALRNGYEPEPEQLYYVDFGKAFGEDRYLNKYDKRDYYGLANKNEPTHYKTQYTMPKIIAIDPRYKAFAVPVEEVDGNE